MDRRYLETVHRNMKRRRPESRLGKKTTGLDGPVVFRRW